MDKTPDKQDMTQGMLPFGPRPPGGSIPIQFPQLPQGATIITPMSEMGIEIDPKGLGPRKLSTFVQRAWSLLFGKRGNSLIPLTADSSGVLYCREEPITDYQASYQEGFLNAGGWVLVDFGHVCRRLFVVGEQAVIRVQFSLDGENWYGDCLPDRQMNWGAGVGTALGVWADFQWVRIKDAFGISILPFGAIGYYKE
jgi:hypothetical protein